MKVQIQREQSSQPITYDNALNCYEKGSFYCVLFQIGNERKTHKYPIVSLFRIIEDYSESKRT